MRHLITALLVLLSAAVARADDRCIGAEHSAAAFDGRTFDPKTGLDTRQYPPDPQVDYTHLKLDLRMPHPSSKSFACTQTLTFKTLGRAIARLKLDAVNLEVKSVKDLSGKPLAFRNDDKHLTVNFPGELAPQT